jgi:hypoxia up-regulated 1
MKRTHKKTLNVETYFVGKVQPLSKDLKEEYKNNIAELARKDKERVMLEEAKNKLESYVYKIKNKLIDEEESIAKISTEEQREQLSKIAMEAEDWLFDEGDSAELETLTAKLEALTVPAEKVWFRLSELTARPAAVKELTERLNETEEKFKKWVENKPQITDEEKDDFLTKIDDARKWLATKVEEQEAKAGHEDPVFVSGEVMQQLGPIQKFLQKLSKKPAPKVEKNETEGTAAGKDNETSKESSEGEEDNKKDESTDSGEEDVKADGEEKEGSENESDAKSDEELTGEEL